MRMMLFCGIVCLSALGMVGCGSEPSRKSEAQTPDSSAAVTSPAPAHPAAIVQNISRIHGVIESISLIDDAKYSVTVFVVTSEPFSGKFSLIEPEQRVTLYPEYVMAASGTGIDPENPRNKKLLALRNAPVGSSFTGKISIDQHGLWKLIEVEE